MLLPPSVILFDKRFELFASFFIWGGVFSDDVLSLQYASLEGESELNSTALFLSVSFKLFPMKNVYRSPEIQQRDVG